VQRHSSSEAAVPCHHWTSTVHVLTDAICVQPGNNAVLQNEKIAGM
jgi:hypothetical protein